MLRNKKIIINKNIKQNADNEVVAGCGKRDIRTKSNENCKTMSLRVTTACFYTCFFLEKQEAQLSPKDRAMRRVN